MHQSTIRRFVNCAYRDIRPYRACQQRRFRRSLNIEKWSRSRYERFGKASAMTVLAPGMRKAARRPPWRYPMLKFPDARRNYLATIVQPVFLFVDSIRWDAPWRSSRSDRTLLACFSISVCFDYRTAISTGRRIVSWDYVKENVSDRDTKGQSSRSVTLSISDPFYYRN